MGKQKKRIDEVNEFSSLEKEVIRIIQEVSHEFAWFGSRRY